MPARSACLVALSLGLIRRAMPYHTIPERFGGQPSSTDVYHTIPYLATTFSSVRIQRHDPALIFLFF